jgi:ACR3 family arsenite efflux pump ArsB
MVLGYLFGITVSSQTVSILKNLIMPFTFLMVYPMMVTLNIKALADGIKNIRLQFFTQFINFAIMPFVAFGLGKIFFPDQPYLALGLLLSSLLPTSGMTISWTGFAKGNLAAAVNMTVIGLTLGSLATPFYVQALMGEKINVDFALVAKQIGLIVFLPMLLGYFTRQAFVIKFGQKDFKEIWSGRFPSLSTIGVLGIVFVAIALKAKGIAHRPEILINIFQPILIIYAFNFVLSTIVGKFFFSRSDAIALVYGTVMRNLSIALAIAVNAFGEKGADTALVIALSYIVQVQSAAWYVKFTDKFFGPSSAEL